MSEFNITIETPERLYDLPDLAKSHEKIGFSEHAATVSAIATHGVREMAKAAMTTSEPETNLAQAIVAAVRLYRRALHEAQGQEAMAIFDAMLFQGIVDPLTPQRRSGLFVRPC